MSTPARSRQNSIRVKSSSLATTEISMNDPITPTISTGGDSLSPSALATQDQDFRHNVLGKVTGLLQKSLLSSRDIMSTNSDEEDFKRIHHKVSDSTIRHPLKSSSVGGGQHSGPMSGFRSLPLSRTNSPVKETKKVFLEYDPITRRKILNTYEILGEIGRGEHGKVKLAKDLVNKQLVAIKIVNRKNKKDRPRLRFDKREGGISEYELKIKREIAIMKKCNHKHIVQLKEVLDDSNTHKIYLVLEYLEKGEVKWKKSKINKTNDSRHHHQHIDHQHQHQYQHQHHQLQFEHHPESHAEQHHQAQEHLADSSIKTEKIPCRGDSIGNHEDKLDEQDLLSNDYSPNLTFKQARKIFRDVLLGLEYLHLQGIVHRDIKPANLLVSSDNTVKISDFGVSFASSLNEGSETVDELELAKTAGTPAFFAPELCQTNFSSSPVASRRSSKNSGIMTSQRKSSSASSLEVLRNEFSLTKILPKIDYKIDIWALGVTFYCLLFGKLPFNAELEYDLFQVIVNQSLEFPNDKDSFNSPTIVSETEFELARDLLNKLLDKNSATRIDIKEIKDHPFILMDLENDLDSLNELLYLNGDPNIFFDNFDKDITKSDIDNAVVGIGTRIKKSIVKAISSGAKDHDIRKKFFTQMEASSSINSSSDESVSVLSSVPVSTSTSTNLQLNTNNYHHHEPPTFQFRNFNANNVDHSVIFSEAYAPSVPTSPYHTEHAQSDTNGSSNTGSLSSFLVANSTTGNYNTGANTGTNTPGMNLHYSSLSHSTTSQPSTPRGSYPLAGIKEGKLSNPILQEVLESTTTNSSRRGSLSGANEIETKRNVGGDLYLKNQSVVDTFKGIQEMDEKRRKSSTFSGSIMSSNPTAKNSISSHTGIPLSQEVSPIQTQPIIQPVNIPNGLSNNIQKQSSDSNNQIRVGPISEGDNGEIGVGIDGRRTSSIMSLPLTESFASLDSINDEYLSTKYKEYTTKKNSHQNNHTHNQGHNHVHHHNNKPHHHNDPHSSHHHTKSHSIDEKITYSEPMSGTTSSINEKFQNFNLNDLMKSKGIQFNFNKPSKTVPEDDIAPNTVIATTGFKKESIIKFDSDSNSDSDSDSDSNSIVSSNQSTNCANSRRSSYNYSRSRRTTSTSTKSYSSRSYSGSTGGAGSGAGAAGSDSSGSESDDSGDSDGEGNLTLAFSSRIPPGTPKFLSLDQRAKSHDSSLPQLPKLAIPTIIDEDQDLEDIPAGLMASVPRPSISVAARPAILSNHSSSALKPGIAPKVPTGPQGLPIMGLPSSAASTAALTTTKPKLEPSPLSATDSTSSNDSNKTIKLGSLSLGSSKNGRQPSPLIIDAPVSANATTNAHTIKRSNPIPIDRNQMFNNHYKKDPIEFPFPNAIHNETDRETKDKTKDKEESTYHYRSNSITIGLLQHESSL